MIKMFLFIVYNRTHGRFYFSDFKTCFILSFIPACVFALYKCIIRCCLSPNDNLLFKATFVQDTKDKFQFIEVDLAVSYKICFFILIPYCSFIRKYGIKCCLTFNPLIKYLDDKLCRQG